MKKIKILGLFSILGLLVVIPAIFIIRLLPTETHYKTIKISTTVVKAEVADTPLKQIEGLMSKKTLPDSQGMFFIFNKEYNHAIWMMNMSFPIDIIWISKDLKIVDIVEGALPCRINCPVYAPDEKALYVLEVNSGFVARNKLRTGDSVAVS